jgi:hypothetical protein
MHEIALLWPKEIAIMDFIDIELSLQSISTIGFEWFRIDWKFWKRLERVADDIANDAKTFRKVSHNWPDFERYWLVLLFRCEYRKRSARRKPGI